MTPPARSAMDPREVRRDAVRLTHSAGRARDRTAGQVAALGQAVYSNAFGANPGSQTLLPSGHVYTGALAPGSSSRGAASRPGPPGSSLYLATAPPPLASGSTSTSMAGSYAPPFGTLTAPDNMRAQQKQAAKDKKAKVKKKKAVQAQVAASALVGRSEAPSLSRQTSGPTSEPVSGRASPAARSSGDDSMLRPRLVRSTSGSSANASNNIVTVATSTSHEPASQRISGTRPTTPAAGTSIPDRQAVATVHVPTTQSAVGSSSAPVTRPRRRRAGARPSAAASELASQTESRPYDLYREMLGASSDEETRLASSSSTRQAAPPPHASAGSHAPSTAEATASGANNSNTSAPTVMEPVQVANTDPDLAAALRQTMDIPSYPPPPFPSGPYSTRPRTPPTPPPPLRPPDPTMSEEQQQQERELERAWETYRARWIAPASPPPAYQSEDEDARARAQPQPQSSLEVEPDTPPVALLATAEATASSLPVSNGESDADQHSAREQNELDDTRDRTELAAPTETAVSQNGPTTVLQDDTGPTEPAVIEQEPVPNVQGLFSIDAGALLQQRLQGTVSQGQGDDSPQVSPAANPDTDTSSATSPAGPAKVPNNAAPIKRLNTINMKRIAAIEQRQRSRMEQVAEHSSTAAQESNQTASVSGSVQDTGSKGVQRAPNAMSGASGAQLPTRNMKPTAPAQGIQQAQTSSSKYHREALAAAERRRQLWYDANREAPQQAHSLSSMDASLPSAKDILMLPKAPRSSVPAHHRSSSVEEGTASGSSGVHTGPGETPDLDDDRSTSRPTSRASVAESNTSHEEEGGSSSQLPKTVDADSDDSEEQWRAEEQAFEAIEAKEQALLRMRHRAEADESSDEDVQRSPSQAHLEALAYLDKMVPRAPPPLALGRSRSGAAFSSSSEESSDDERHLESSGSEPEDDDLNIQLKRRPSDLSEVSTRSLDPTALAAFNYLRARTMLLTGRNPDDSLESAPGAQPPVQDAAPVTRRRLPPLPQPVAQPTVAQPSAVRAHFVQNDADDDAIAAHVFSQFSTEQKGKAPVRPVDHLLFGQAGSASTSPIVTSTAVQSSSPSTRVRPLPVPPTARASASSPFAVESPQAQPTATSATATPPLPPRPSEGPHPTIDGVPAPGLSDRHSVSSRLKGLFDVPLESGTLGTTASQAGSGLSRAGAIGGRNGPPPPAYFTRRFGPRPASFVNPRSGEAPRPLGRLPTITSATRHYEPTKRVVPTSGPPNASDEVATAMSPDGPVQQVQTASLTSPPPSWLAHIPSGERAQLPRPLVPIQLHDGNVNSGPPFSSAIPTPSPVDIQRTVDGVMEERLTALQRRPPPPPPSTARTDLTSAPTAGPPEIVQRSALPSMSGSAQQSQLGQQPVRSAARPLPAIPIGRAPQGDNGEQHQQTSQTSRTSIPSDTTERVTGGSNEPTELEGEALLQRARSGLRPPRREPSLGITDLDVLVSQLENEGDNYENLAAISEFLGPAKSTKPSASELAALSVGHVELERRRVNAEGRVKQKLSVAGVRVDRCGICLVQFREGDECCLWPCVHIFHRTCSSKWLLQARVCPTCRRDIASV